MEMPQIKGARGNLHINARSLLRLEGALFYGGSLSLSSKSQPFPEPARKYPKDLSEIIIV